MIRNTFALFCLLLFFLMPPTAVLPEAEVVSFSSGQLTLRGALHKPETRPVTVEVSLKDGHYTGAATVKQADFGIKPPGKAGVKAKDEVKIQFDVQLAS
jgi:hypothetical protein